MRAAAWFWRRSVPGRGPEGSAHDPAQLRDPGSSRAGDQPGADSADPGGPWLARTRCRGGLGRQRGAEPLTDGRDRVLVVPGRGAAGPGMTLFLSRAGNGAVSRPPLRQRPAGTRRRGIRGANRRPSGQASAAGGRGLTRRSSPPGWRSPAGAGQVTRPPRRARHWPVAGPLAAAARPRARARPRSCPVRRRQLGNAAGRRSTARTARRRHRAVPGGPRPPGHWRRRRSSCHRCRIRSRQARDLARRLASGTGGLSRLRGTTSAMSHGHDDDQADGHALLR
jgi:hypothetical protein